MTSALPRGTALKLLEEWKRKHPGQDFKVQPPPKPVEIPPEPAKKGKNRISEAYETTADVIQRTVDNERAGGPGTLKANADAIADWVMPKPKISRAEREDMRDAVSSKHGGF